MTAADCKSVLLRDTTGFDSLILHHVFRLVSIMVITADCLSAYGSSILPRVAKSQSMEVVYPSGLISHEIVGSNPTSATIPAANHC